MKITVVTAGHLSTCPRMVKAADALAQEGHDVRVVSTRSTPWASEADESVIAHRRGLWRWSVVDYTRARAPLTYVTSGIKQRLADRAAHAREPLAFDVAAKALFRVHDDLVRAALTSDVDVVYGGTVGGIGAAYAAATEAGCAYALDLEDFYSGDHPEDPDLTRLIERVEEETLSGARCLTAASVGIADAYRDKYGVASHVVHNTFSLPSRPPSTDAPVDRLKLYWFSQTIGPGRGLEDVVEAMGRADVATELHLRGNPDIRFVERLRSAVEDETPALGLVVHDPAPPDSMVELLANVDVGLAIEQGASVNREICLTNKALTYMLGGLALVMTETAGHQPLIDAVGDSSVHYPPGDVATLASGLERLARDATFLKQCRQASWSAATSRWHWEHPDERGRLVSLFASTT